MGINCSICYIRAIGPISYWSPIGCLVSFRAFLGTTEIVPDSTTIWLFRERLAESGKDKDVWHELQKQLEAMNLEVKKGIMQDASFITSDPGHAKKDTPRGDEAKTRRSRDGIWAKKGTKSYFGYKLHGVMGTIYFFSDKAEAGHIDLKVF